MNARNPPESGWFVGLDPAEKNAARAAIREGETSVPEDWPARAVETGFATDRAEYYETLRETAIDAAREAVTERERADDHQLAHAIRALDDCERTANELLERVSEWAGTHDEDARVDMEYARELADREPADPVEAQIVSLATRAVDLDEQARSLRAFIERSGPEVAPNLAALAGPVLAARLIALAGGLESLAKKPSGTVQVLGAEDALFAHLRGNAPSPKHGIIYTHEAVRATPSDQRGSAARALAGKLTIAARIDQYSGDLRPQLQASLEKRIERIRARDET